MARTTETTRITSGGRVVIPAEMRRALGVRTGDEVLIRLEGHELRLYTPAEAIRQAQEAVRRHIPAGRSLSDELIRERRAEAAQEMEEVHASEDDE